MVFDPRFTYVTDDRITADALFFDILQKTIKGGATMVQLREKNSHTKAFYNRALQAKKMCDAKQLPLIINDRADIALAVNAQGLHIGQDDLPYTEARRIMGKEAIIGLSVSNVAQAVEAASLGVDYIGVSPLFATQTKTQNLEPPLGLKGLAAIREVFTGPIVVIGGITLENTAQAVAYGADGIAVVSAISKAEDPFTSTKEFLKLL